MISPVILSLLVANGFTDTYAYNRIQHSTTPEKLQEKLFDDLVVELEKIDQHILDDLARLHFKDKLVSFAIRNEVVRRKRKEEDDSWNRAKARRRASDDYTHQTRRK